MTLIISCSLNPKSRSRVLAHKIKTHFENAELIDLRDFNLPICDGAAAYGNENVIKITKIITEADSIILAVPIYNYAVNAAAKNLVELTGKDAWQKKIFSFVCAAGGKSSYMAPIGLANNLMLDFRCFFVPNYVYADASCFNEEKTEITSVDVKERLQKLAVEVERVSDKLN